MLYSGLQNGCRECHWPLAISQATPQQDVCIYTFILWTYAVVLHSPGWLLMVNDVHNNHFAIHCRKLFHLCYSQNHTHLPRPCCKPESPLSTHTHTLMCTSSQFCHVVIIIALTQSCHHLLTYHFEAFSTSSLITSGSSIWEWSTKPASASSATALCTFSTLSKCLFQRANFSSPLWRGWPVSSRMVSAGVTLAVG